MTQNLLPDLIRSLPKLNRYVARKALRQYQSDLLSTGTFTLRLDATGEELNPMESRLVAGHHIAYLFRPVGQQPFWLCTALIARGYPLAVMVSEGGGVQWAFANRGAIPPERLKRYTALPNSSRTPLEPYSPDQSRTCLVVGHPNFAHFIWNELSGLASWLTGADPRRIEQLLVLPTHEPAGPIDALVPQLPEAGIVRSPESKSNLRQGGAGLHVRTGSEIVSKQARKILVDFATARADPEFAARIASFRRERHPIIWISIRHSKRTAQNLSDFIKAVVAEIRDRYPAAGFVFDGFSVPLDYVDNPSYDALRPDFSERIDRISRIIGEIASDEERRQPGFLGAMINLNGLRLVESFYTALKCDFYISHAGTLQHKIGWINPVPGIMHLPPPLKPKRAERYYASMVEDGRGPSILNPTAIRRVKPLGDAERDHRNDEYIFTDIPAAVDDVITKLDRSIGATSVLADA